MLTAFIAVWNFFTKSWGRYILPLLVLAGLFLFVFIKGEDHQKTKDNEQLVKITAVLKSTTDSLKSTTAILKQETDAINLLKQRQKLAKEDSDKVVSDLQNQLTNALNKKPTVVTIIKQVPTYVCPDPARRDGYLVMCEVLNADGTPHETNGRATIDDDDNDFWFGFQRLNRIFEGQLETILGDINEEMWQRQA